MPSAGIRDVLVVSLKEEKQVRFHSTYTASHEVRYLHFAVPEFTISDESFSQSCYSGRVL